MRVLRLAVPLLVAFSLTACGGDEEEVLMPDVTGAKLDVAYDKIAGVGFEDKDKVTIEGGGTFGVVMEGNWTVCEQKPASGKPIVEDPTLTVARSCAGDAEQPSDTASESGAASEEPSPTPSVEPTPELPEVLTAKNNAEFATILQLGDACSGRIGKFAKKYEGQKVRFDGNMADVAGLEGTTSRFNYLVAPGDFQPDSTRGPAFQMADENAGALNLTGKKIPDYIRRGQNYTFTVELGEFDADTCLYQVEPVETATR